MLGSLTLAALLAVPAHVNTYLYDSAAGTNQDIPAAYMARHATFVETDGTHPQLIRAFKHAGGRYAVAYVDPTFVPYCSPPFLPPAGRCKGPIGRDVTDESGWMHGRDGARLHRPAGGPWGYQEILNPASPQARDAFARYTRQLVARAPIDLFFVDDAGGTLAGPDGTSRSGLFYRFDDSAVEVGDDGAWIAGERAMLAAAARPAIVNGGGVDGSPAYGGTFLRGDNVVGQNHEDCFSQEGPVALASGDRWRRTEDGLLAVTRTRSFAICMMKGPPTPENRLYALASWWLTYDPQWSVAAPVERAPDGHAVFAEYAIVPRDPLESARDGVASLRRGSVYVRRFRACYQDRVPIGPCAAIVNPSDAPAQLPVLRGYDRHLALDSSSAYAGGRAVWPAGVPTVLGPMAAAVIANGHSMPRSKAAYNSKYQEER